MSPADQGNLAEVFEEFWRALDDVEEHLCNVHETAWPGDWWDGGRLRGECVPYLVDEIGRVFDARKGLHALAPKVAAHVIAPPGQTGAQWVLEALALADEAYRLANEEYRRCNLYQGPMDPDLVVENYNDREWREPFKDALRQIEEDYQRVRCGLPKARQHLNRVMSVVLPPTADTEAAASAPPVPAIPAPGETLPHDDSLPSEPQRTGDVPVWDRERGELSFQGKVVKSFRQPAPNQRCILDAFQECGWPPRMDDPLRHNAKVDQRERLANTIRSLNSNGAIRFELDGTGKGVLWEPANATPLDSNPT